VWNVDCWPLDSEGKAMKRDTSPRTGDPTLWRDPLDFCYTTTMRKDEFNWAYLIVTVSALTVLVYMLWFPIHLRRTISTLLPRIPEYNELGSKRSKDDIDIEYNRLLAHDSSPLNFLYHVYKRRWGTYKPLYLLIFKSSNMMIISVFTQDNCLWRRYDAKTMSITKEGVLIGVQIVLLIAHLLIRPFVNEIGNRSELVSRIGYVLDSVLGLLVALQLKDIATIDVWILYLVYAVTYSLNIYFALIGATWMGHVFKQFQQRIDFSIDVFSPFLHLEQHIKRRVWQEALSTVLLSGREYRMPLNQLVTFSVQDDCPPYLLAFQGTAAERHVENLKILQHVGVTEYANSVEILRGKDSSKWKRIMKQIQLNYAGPDAYWKPLDGIGPPGVSTFFGKAFLVPFPPTLTIRYDQTMEDELKVVRLTELSELETFAWQNRSEVVQRRRWIRTVLRALDGQQVHCPHVEAVEHGSRRVSRSCLVAGKRKDYQFASPVFYSTGVLTIQRKGAVQEQHGTYNFQSGFQVAITYDYGECRDAGGAYIKRKGLTIDGAAAFGLGDDFEWTPSVQRFFHSNSGILQGRLGAIQDLLNRYRQAFYNEARSKRNTMGYSFLVDIFEKPVLEAEEMEALFQHSSCSKAIRELPARYPATTTLLLQRLNHLARSPLHRWWFLFWDDLWRQNQEDYKCLSRHEGVFSPQFPTSIGWTPLPRHQLEERLRATEGVWSEKGTKRTIFHSGLLNQMYFALDGLASSRMEEDLDKLESKIEPIHLGVCDDRGEVTAASPSLISSSPLSRLTGGGTDHDDGSILNRHAWHWTEERLSGRAKGGIFNRLKRFLAVYPYMNNKGVGSIWIYARLTNEGSGQWRYETEKRERESLRNNHDAIGSPHA
jgi:hypothetical protein